MSNVLWFLLVGGLLLVMGLHSSIIKRLPITPAILYLTVGLIFGPTLLGAYHFNPLKQSHMIKKLIRIDISTS